MGVFFNCSLVVFVMILCFKFVYNIVGLRCEVDMCYYWNVVVYKEMDGFGYVFVVFKFYGFVLGFFYDFGCVLEGDVGVFFIGVKGYVDDN